MGPIVEVKPSQVRRIYMFKQERWAQNFFLRGSQRLPLIILVQDWSNCFLLLPVHLHFSPLYAFVGSLDSVICSTKNSATALPLPVARRSWGTIINLMSGRSLCAISLISSSSSSNHVLAQIWLTLVFLLENRKAFLRGPAELWWGSSRLVWLLGVLEELIVSSVEGEGSSDYLRNWRCGRDCSPSRHPCKN